MSVESIKLWNRWTIDHVKADVEVGLKLKPTLRAHAAEMTSQSQGIDTPTEDRLCVGRRRASAVPGSHGMGVIGLASGTLGINRQTSHSMPHLASHPTRLLLRSHMHFNR